jgi:ATP-binding cassette subfamily C protein CydC
LGGHDLCAYRADDVRTVIDGCTQDPHIFNASIRENIRLAVSGGERQRLALARALLAGPDLLILDEPTAHLNPETRTAIMADLLEVTEGRATLLITHELRGLDQVDEIVVLEAGKIASRGTHQALLGECPLYRQMREAEQALTAAFRRAWARAITRQGGCLAAALRRKY